MSNEQAKKLRNIFKADIYEKEDIIILIDRWVGKDATKDFGMFRVFMNAIRNLIVHIKDSITDERIKVSIIQYDSSYARVLTPFSSNYDEIIQSTNNLSFASYHNVKDGFTQAKEMFTNARKDSKKKLFIFSDGYEVDLGSDIALKMFSDNVQSIGIWVDKKYGSQSKWMKVTHDLICFDDVHDVGKTFQKLNDKPPKMPEITVIQQNMTSMDLLIDCNYNDIEKFILYQFNKSNEQWFLVKESVYNEFHVDGLIPDTDYFFQAQVEMNGSLFPEKIKKGPLMATKFRTLQNIDHWDIVNDENLLMKETAKMKDFFVNFKNEEHQQVSKKVNILVVGRIGAGKSAFLSTLASCHAGKYTPVFNSDSQLTSVTKKLKKLPIFGEVINIVDMFGWQQEVPPALDHVLHGRLKEGYKEGDVIPSVFEKPDFQDVIHAVIFVVDWRSGAQQSYITFFNEIKQIIVAADIQPFVVMTKFDNLDEIIGKDSKHIYNYGKIFTTMKAFSEKTGVARKNIFPMINYLHAYDKPDYVIEYSALNILKNAITFAHTKFYDEKIEKGIVSNPTTYSPTKTLFLTATGKPLSKLSKNELWEKVSSEFESENAELINKILKENDIDGDIMQELISEDKNDFDELFGSLKRMVQKRLKRMK